MTKKLSSWKTITAKKEYLRSLIDSNKTEPTEYNMKNDHQKGDFVSHPKFGLGFVQGTIGEKKIQVFFEQFEKVLLQNWT